MSDLLKRQRAATSLPRGGVDPFKTEQWALVLPRGAFPSPTVFASPTRMTRHPTDPQQPSSLQPQRAGDKRGLQLKAVNSQAITVPGQESYKSTDVSWVFLSFINNSNRMPCCVWGYWYRQLGHGSSYLLQYGKGTFVQDTKPQVTPEQKWVSNNINQMNKSASEQKFLSYK